MALAGTVIDGAIVFDEPVELPDGCRVEVIVSEAPPAPGGAGPTLLSLLKLAGTAKDLPEDFAAQHDHYLHRTPRR